MNINSTLLVQACNVIVTLIILDRLLFRALAAALHEENVTAAQQEADLHRAMQATERTAHEQQIHWKTWQEKIKQHVPVISERTCTPHLEPAEAEVLEHTQRYALIQELTTTLIREVDREYLDHRR